MPTTDPTTPAVRWQLRVRYHECDPQSVVFNAVYYSWADMGSLEFWRASHGKYQNLLDEGVDMVVVASSGRFHAPATYDDELDLDTRVTRVGTTSHDLTTTITRDGAPIATLVVTYVMIDLETGAKTEPPPSVRAALGVG